MDSIKIPFPSIRRATYPLDRVENFSFGHDRDPSGSGRLITVRWSGASPLLPEIFSRQEHEAPMPKRSSTRPPTIKMRPALGRLWMDVGEATVAVEIKVPPGVTDVVSLRRALKLLPTATANSKKACSIAKPFEVWRALMVFNMENFVHHPRETPGQIRFEKAVERAARAVRADAIRVKRLAPLGQQWILGKNVGPAVAVVRALKRAARELDAIHGKLVKPNRPRGAAPADHSRLWIFMDLIGFTFRQLAEMILASSDDWNIPPCDQTVQNYKRLDPKPAATQLGNRLRELHRRRTRNT